MLLTKVTTANFLFIVMSSISLKTVDSYHIWVFFSDLPCFEVDNEVDEIDIKQEKENNL